jgi:hypothetical protein
MGLHNTANYLKTKGRGRDTELVHMSPREIKGLQALALAHGGSLTVNPETGLVEAGFLERILPMVAGAALSFVPGVGPFAAAALVGGGYGVATGSVEKGLMAGLGAYGGAGLAGSLSAMGGQAAAQAGQQAAVKGFETTAQEAVAQGSQEVAKEAAKTAALEGTTLPANYADLYAKTGGAQEFTKQAAQGFLENPNNFPGLTSQTLQGYQSALNAPGAVPTDVIGAAGSAQGAAGATTAGNVARGVKEVSTSLPAAGDFIGSNIGTIGSAAIPLLAADQQGAPTGYTEDEYDRYLKGYKLGPNYQAYEAPRPNPYYRPQYAAQGGIMKLQGGGGPVERMSMMNTAMNPQGGMYPQGMIDKTQYATPTQRPVSAELMMDAPAYERSSPMLMAEGGIARYAPGGQINLQGSFNLDQGNMNSQAFPGAATVGSGMAPMQTGPTTGGPGMGPSKISPMALPFTGPATGGLGMVMNHMYQPQLAVMPQQSMARGGIARYRNRGQVNVLQDYIDRQGQQQMSPLSRSPGMPDGGIYRDTDVDTAKKDALTATMIRLGKTGKGAGIKPVALPKTAIKGLGDIRGATPEVEQAAAGGAMRYNLGGYSDGGRMLKGPGDGMSDSIPATIAGKQPARLADGEFVVPADVVSHLGNGSTDAGAKKLYGMMAKIRKARTGKKKQAPAVKANKYMPA